MFGWFKGKKELSSAVVTRTFLDGAYRLHRTEDVKKYTALAASAFPTFADRITCFGSDWLGRQFATDEKRMVGRDRQILMLEPGTGEVLEIPVGFALFHSGELVEQSDAVAAVNFFGQWLAAGGDKPGYGQCIGYKKPLFLGAADGIDNLELIDFEVYWSVAGQILAQLRGLPAGTKIGSVSIQHTEPDN